MKARKKPIIIEAIQWAGNNLSEIHQLGNIKITAWGSDSSIVIRTLEGDMTANLGDYIIKGVKGEFYPCKKEIFKETYEVVEE